MNAIDGHEKWNELVREWEIAFRLAQIGQGQIIQKMQACYNDKGVNPTQDEMEKVDELWANEKRARALMDDFIKKHFG